jgi:D-xylose reductase
MNPAHWAGFVISRPSRDPYDSRMLTPTITLPGGDRMPVVGLGLWKVPRDAAPQLVETAIRTGYRHLDCACDYANEPEVGAGIRAALTGGACRRDELWVTSKLWNTYHAPEHVRPAAERTLRDLGLDHLDLYLVHFPIPLQFVPFDRRYPPGWLADPGDPRPHMRFATVPLADTWRAMEDLVTAGVVRNIGVCNYTTVLLRDLLSYARVRPAVLQVELHPYLVQPRLVRFCHEAGIAVTGFSPLGALSYVPIGMATAAESVLEQPAVKAAAARHGKTPAQVVLRWGVQRGNAIVPKTTRPERLAENLALFDFELTADEMAAITALDRGRRFNDPGDFGEAAFNTFCPIYD